MRGRQVGSGITVLGFVIAALFDASHLALYLLQALAVIEGRRLFFQGRIAGVVLFPHGGRPLVAHYLVLVRLDLHQPEDLFAIRAGQRDRARMRDITRDILPMVALPSTGGAHLVRAI